MKYAFTKIRFRLSLTEVLYLVFFVGLVCAFRAVTSICIGVMIVAGIVLHKQGIKSIFKGNPVTLFIIGCFIFFFLQAFSLLYTTNLEEGLNDTRLKSGLLFTPLAALFLFASGQQEAEKIYAGYCYLLFFASVYLLFSATNAWIQHNTTRVFFYHALVSPFRFHAVYYSILVFIALLFISENFVQRTYLWNKPFHLFLLLFFTCFLFLLASKLVISFYIVYCLFFLLTRQHLFNKSRLFIHTLTVLLLFSTAFVLVTKNPVSARFRDFLHGNVNLITQDKFSPAVYFNGLQFRLLEWRLVPQILNEKHCWWTGVSTGDAQTILNQKYIALSMYRGEHGKPDGGYLGYNTHNQLLQSLLQNGIPGAACFLFICATLIVIASRAKKRILSFSIILLLCYLFVESLFEEQYGIVIFCFWPVFLAQYCKTSSVAPLKTSQPI